MMAAVLAAELWVAGGTLVLPSGPRAGALHVVDGRIAAITDAAPAGAAVIDAKGLWVAPAVVDAHVHLKVAGPLKDVARKELAGGVAAVLDLGVPERDLAELPGLAPLRVLFAGPLLTAPKGYPTQSWGKDGYGLEVPSPAAAAAAVGELAKAGARFVKLAFDARYPTLPLEVARAAVEAAHAKHLLVAAHALDAAMVERALQAGADVLAHTPVEPLPDALVRLAGERRVWVLSTLHAFGGSAAAVDNLRRLRAAGARVAYGTDLGNTGTAPGVMKEELALLASAGLDAQAVLRAATSAPAELMGLHDLGALEPGKRASALLLRRDPLADPTALADAAAVLIDGVRQ